MAKQTYNISGVIKDNSKKGISNLRVEAWDKDLLIDDFVGEATTDKNGKFKIGFTVKRFRELFLDRKPDIFFKVYSGEILLHSTEQSVVWNMAEDQDNIEIILSTNSDKNVIEEKSSGFTLTGMVKHLSGNPVAGINVVVSEKMLRSSKRLANTTTDSSGIYSFSLENQIPKTAYSVEVKGADGKILASAEFLLNKIESITQDFTIEDPQYKGTPLFKLNQPVLNKYLEQLKKGGEKKPLSIDDVNFVANQVGTEPRDTFHWLRANEMEAVTAIPAEAFYGMFKGGLPTNLDNLTSVDAKDMKTALINAASSNYVSDELVAKADDMIAKWNDYSIEEALKEVPRKMDASLGQLLGLAVSDQASQKKILTAYLNHPGDQQSFWESLGSISGNKETANKVQNVLKLGSLTANQPILTAALYKRLEKSDNLFYELASMDANEWSKLITDLSTQEKKSIVPAFIEAETESKRVAIYANQMSVVLEQQYPTHSFFGKLAKQPKDASAFAGVKDDMVMFFSNNPSFDLKSSATLKLLSEENAFNFKGIEDKSKLVIELQSAQRLSAYSTDFGTINALKLEGMDSAYNIVEVPQNTFVHKISAAAGSVDKAQLIYNKAEKNFMKSALYWSKLHPNLSFKTTTTPDPIAEPTLRTMFGSLDACECEHCTSVFSPAAYYTDILNFLYSRSPEVYQELIRRRPDLVHIELTCENTNTPLPYVDLVNELLENFILTHKTSPVVVPASYQTTWQARELAANPEHISYDAYTELKTAVYPGSLPFNLPVEETRVYLKHLGVQKAQLMAAFYGGSKEAAFDDFNINMERLHFNPQEAKILSGETTGDGTADSGLWNFYGFNKANGYKPLVDPADSSKNISGGSWDAAVTGRIDVFLQQLDLSYKELLTLLLCDSINPVTGVDGSGNAIRAISIVSIDGDNSSCELDNLKLSGVTTTHLKKIHLFIRLWKKTGWTLFDLDRACIAFGLDFGNNVVQNKSKLNNIAQTDVLAKQLRLPVESILAFWSSISTRSYIDYFKDNYPPIISLYEKLFSNKAVLNPVDPAFNNAAALAGLLDDHSATVVAALQISDEDYTYLKAELPDNNLSLSNLGILYRNSVLARKLRLNTKDFLSLKKLIGAAANPFASPISTFSFLLKADTVKTSGFSIDQLNYLLQHEYLEETSVAPQDDDISVFLSELRIALRAIETSSADEQRNTIIQKFSEKLKISASAAGLLLQSYIKGITNPLKAVVEDFRADDFSTLNFLKSFTDTSDPTNPKDYEPKFVRTNPTADTALDAESDLFNDYMRLDKIASIINKLKLSDTDLEAVLKNAASLLCTDLTTLPVSSIVGNFNSFEILVNIIKARDTMPVGTPDFFDIVLTAIVNPDKTKWLDNLATRTNWDREILESLVGDGVTLVNAGILKTNFPASFVNGEIILQIKNCLSTINRIGLNTSLIQSAIAVDFDHTVSDAIKNAAKAKYDEGQWLKLAKPLRDDLRERQRVALVSFVVTHAKYDPPTSYERWKNTDELYEYFLIDVEMKPINMTSRIKQAICSVQLFIDRVLLNLEHPNSNPSVTALKLDGDQVEEWEEWRKIYRIWEANRKIFLYPENWIEPELRDDKSPFFKDLETQLKQNELNEDNVEDAFHNYLSSLDEVSRLEVVGMYHQVEKDLPDEDDIDILHVFARTSSNPSRYYHRTLEDGEWTSWLKLEIDVDGNHLVPVIFNRKLCLFWLFFVQDGEESNDISDPQPLFWKIQVAWSEYKKNKWTAKRLSKSFITSQSVLSRKLLEDMRTACWTKASVAGSTLSISVEGSVSGSESAFIFNNTSEEPHFSNFYTLIPGGNVLTWVGIENVSGKEEMQVSRTKNGYLSFQIDHDDLDGGVIISTDHIKVLNKGNEDKFKLVVPETGPHAMPEFFFFQDKDHTFYVTHRVVDVPTYTKPDYGIGDWYHDIQRSWRDYYTYTPIEDPEGPIVNPGRNYTDPIPYIDEYFREAQEIKVGIKKAAVQEKTIEFKTATVIIHGNEGVNVGATESTIQPLMMKSANKEYGISSSYQYEVEPEIKLISKGQRLIKKYTEEHHFTFTTFYHYHVKTFIKELYKLGIEGLLKRSVETQADTILFKKNYDPTNLVTKPYPTSEVDFVYGSAYSQYNWELFFHVPMLIACRLKDDQRFEEARDWFHYIFDPTQSEGGDKERFWQFKPFFDEAGTQIATLDDLLKNETELAAQVDKWMKNPFMPHVIARMRISAYMRNVVMKYLDNIIAWGDNLFRRDTIEAINEATNLYIMAAKILGERPQQIPPRAEHADASFDDIKDELDSFSNAMVAIETMLAPSSSSGSGSGSSNALGEMFYFCVPRNEFLMKYWDTVADRLFKIRNSMNIQGIVRTLPLFEPPIDPAMLVRAAAAGMDLSSILSDLNAALPNYRFNFMLQKALEFSNEVKSLGSALLQALEKRDAEAFSLLRSVHEQKMLNVVLGMKEKQVEDAKIQVESSKKMKEVTQLKADYYGSREFMNIFEKQQLVSVQIGMIFSAIQGGLSTIGGVLAAIPNLKAGAPTSMGVTWGGDNLGAMMNAMSSYMGIFSAINNAAGSMAGTFGNYTRRMDDWKFQSESANKELEQIDKQIISAEIKQAIAERDLMNQQLQIENNKEADEFMRSKFTNQQLYDWMIGQISTVYFQSYQLAYDLAKKAEQCYQYELGEYRNTSFVQFGYWDSLKKGLLSAEKLQYDLRRMESSYYDLNRRELEMTKHVSLLLLNPQAILDLRANGTCTFIIPEALFDLDFPGHFFRRIKTVSLSIPCIAGPYTTISATLRLKKHTTRLNASGTNYDSADYAADDRFKHITAETHCISTSTAQNDSGVFDLNFRDERYLPFEGCGAFGEWELEMNTEADLRMFDYNTISDIIMTIRYSAREEGTLKGTVNTYLKGLIQSTIAPTDSSSGMVLNRLFSLKHEYSSEWHKMFYPSGGGIHIMNFDINKSQLPFFVQERDVAIGKVYLIGSFTNSTDTYDLELTSNGGAVLNFSLSPGNSYQDVSSALPSGFGLGSFTFKIKKASADIPDSEVKDIGLILDYQCS